MNKTLLKFIKVKSRIYKKIYKATDLMKKLNPKKIQSLQEPWVTLSKICKGNYYKEYFEDKKKMQKNCGVKLDLQLILKTKNFKN